MNCLKWRAPRTALILLLAICGVRGAAAQAQPAQAPVRATSARALFVTANKSVVIDSPVDIERVSVANGDIAEGIVVNPREVVVNGKKAGETSLLIWQRGGSRLLFDVTVRTNPWEQNAAVNDVRAELKKQLPGQQIELAYQNNTAFLSGTVDDLVSADRAAAIAGTLGKVVNLLNVRVPPVEAQVLLKVRFANVDRSAISELGVNLLSTGVLGTIGRTTTGQFPAPNVTVEADKTEFTLSDALNIFLFRRDLDLGATIRALNNRRLLEILAEPNVLAINGKRASFLAGGEFPYPTLQGGGAGLGSVTIQFREFGIRLNFLPTVTPRGTIRLQVTPEVSALDYANGLIFQGFTIPGLSTRRVQTEIELEARQSFAIAGLLDNRITENLSKVPGLGDIPLLGKLFQSKGLNKSNTELLVLVTPELVRPIPADQKTPEIEFPRTDFVTDRKDAPRTPGLDVTGPVPVKAVRETIPVEQLIEIQRPAQPQGTQPPVQYVPVPVPVLPPAPQPDSQAPATAEAPTAARAAAQ